MVNLTRIVTHHQPEHFDHDLIRLALSVVLPLDIVRIYEDEYADHSRVRFFFRPGFTLVFSLHFRSFFSNKCIHWLLFSPQRLYQLMRVSTETIRRQRSA